MSNDAPSAKRFNLLLVLLIVFAVIGIVATAFDFTPGDLTLGQAFTALTLALAFLYLLVLLLLLTLRRILTELTEVRGTHQELQAQHQELQRSVLSLTDDSPVLAIEGIGEGYAKRLEGKGITHMRHLLRVDAQALADEFAMPVKVVQGWKEMAELIQIRGIGPQYAELLVRAGVHSIADLAGEDPEGLAIRCEEANLVDGVRIQKNEIKPSMTKRWIDEAKSLQ